MAYAYPVAAFDMEVKARLQAVTRAIAPSANTPDYARILEFCDIISRDGSGRAASTTAQCLVTIMKEESSYLVLFITLHAIELLVHNCGSYFHDMIANERFVKALIGVGGKYLKKRENFRIEDANSAKASDQIPGNQKALKYAVRMKAMALVQSLGIGFQHDARHSIFYVEYQRLVAKGIQFPVHKPTDFAPIATPAPHGAAPAPLRHVPPSGPAPVPARGGGAPNAADNFTVIKNNVTLLADMLRNNDNVSQNDLVQELASGARTVKPQVQSWIAGNTEHPSLGLALEVNDLIESTLALYAQRTSGRPSGPVGGPRIDDGKARNSPGVGGNGVGAGAGAGGKARRNSSSSSDSDSSADDDFAALSHRHGPPPPILQPISPSSSSAAAAPPSSQLPVYAYSLPAAPAPAPSAAPPAQGYPPPPPQGYAPVPMYVPGPDGKPVLVYMYPPGAYPPAGQFAPQYANANPYPSPSGPPPAPNPAYAGAAASAAPAASAPPSAYAFAPAPQPASAPASASAPAAAVGASAPNPFISPATAPANAHPQPVPGAQPVYVLWPPAGGAPASPASAPPPAASPPAAAASASPFAPVPMPHVAPAPQPVTAPTAPNPFLGSST